MYCLFRLLRSHWLQLNGIFLILEANCYKLPNVWELSLLDQHCQTSYLYLRLGWPSSRLCHYRLRLWIEVDPHILCDSTCLPHREVCVLNWWVCWGWDHLALVLRDKVVDKVNYASTYGREQMFLRYQFECAGYPWAVEKERIGHRHSTIQGRYASLYFKILPVKPKW